MEVNIGERFKDIRVKLKYPQKIFADMLGMTQSKLSKIECGNIKPDVYDIFTLCKVTSTSIYDLYDVEKFDFNILSPNQRLLMEKAKMLNDTQILRLIDLIDSMVRS